jgi:hypothetical protein
MFIPRPRFPPIAFDWSHDGNVFHLPRLPIQLSKKFKRRFDHCLSACEIRKSKIRKAGRGVFLQESASSGQIIFKYGGVRISLTEADRLAELVTQPLSPFFRITVCIGLMYSSCLMHIFQGLDSHIKENILYAFCFDSRPTLRNPVEWFVRNHLIGGFVNSNARKLCNAKFVTIGDEIYIQAIKPIKKGEEVYVHYKVR